MRTVNSPKPSAWTLFRSQHLAVQILVWVCALPVPLWLWALQVRKYQWLAIFAAGVATLSLVSWPFTTRTDPVVSAGAPTTTEPEPTTSTTSTTTTAAPTTAPPPTTAPTTAPMTAPPTPAPPAGPAALVSQLTVAPEANSDSYDRDLFDHWIDADSNGCNTRCEVLAAERHASLPGLAGGGWLSAYDGYSTNDASEFDIDHMVPLAEAWRSGASQWSAERRRDYANDLGSPASLIAVTAATNRSKGDRDPAIWQPPNQAAWCSYVSDWASTKLRWGLTADQAEVNALTNMARGC